MKKELFLEINANNEKVAEMLSRAEKVAKSIKLSKKEAENFKVMLDYETINDTCTTKEARADYIHLYFNKHNACEIYLKSKSECIVLVRNSIMTESELDNVFSDNTYSESYIDVIAKNTKLTRVYCDDDEVNTVCKVVIKHILAETTTATKQTAEAKKEA